MSILPDRSLSSASATAILAEEIVALAGRVDALQRTVLTLVDRLDELLVVADGRRRLLHRDVPTPAVESPRTLEALG